MQITDELVDKLATLSRLSFSENEKKTIVEDLQKMVNFVDKLNEVDTTGIEPLLHINESPNRLRQDEVSGMLTPTDALKNASVKDEHYFKVPKVISR